MNLINITNWRDNIRLLTYKEFNHLVTVTHLNDEPILCNKSEINSDIDLAIELSESIAKIRFNYLDNIESIAQAKDYIYDKNSHLTRYMKRTIQIH